MPGCSWNPSEAWIICIKIGQHSGPYESILCNSCQYFYTWESGFILYYCSGINTPIALTKCYTSIIGISLGSEGYQHQSRQLHTSLTLLHSSCVSLCSIWAVCGCSIWMGILSAALTRSAIRKWKGIIQLLTEIVPLSSPLPILCLELLQHLMKYLFPPPYGFLELPFLDSSLINKRQLLILSIEVIVSFKAIFGVWE